MSVVHFRPRNYIAQAHTIVIPLPWPKERIWTLLQNIQNSGQGLFWPYHRDFYPAGIRYPRSPLSQRALAAVAGEVRELEYSELHYCSQLTAFDPSQHWARPTRIQFYFADGKTVQDCVLTINVQSYVRRGLAWGHSLVQNLLWWQFAFNLKLYVRLKNALKK